MVKTMKNIEVVQALNNLSGFVKAQSESQMAYLSVSGQFAIKANEKSLMDKYKPYEDTLKDLQAEETVDEDKFKELLELEVEVDIRTIGEGDFKDGVTINEIMLLEFMTE